MRNQARAVVIGGRPEEEASFEDRYTHVKTVLDIDTEFNVGVEIHADYMGPAWLRAVRCAIG